MPRVVGFVVSAVVLLVVLLIVSLILGDPTVRPGPTERGVARKLRTGMQ